MVESDLSEAIQLCIGNWTAMKLAIDLGWGESHHKENLQRDLQNYIVSFEVTIDDVSQYLDEIMEDRFSVLLDDGSSSEIAAILLKVFEESCQGKQDELKRIRQINSVDTELCKKIKPPPNLVENLENLDIEVPELVSNIDEDGFEKVVSRKNKKHK